MTTTTRLLTDNGTFGTTRTDDSSQTWTAVRGVTEQDGIYTAFSHSFSKDFKTLGGAVRYMARMGYDAYGQRA
jgi:hypothetical protein